MRANLTFELPDEEYLFECAIRGADVIAELNEVQYMIKSAIKHGHDYKTIEEALDVVYVEICAILQNVKDCG